MCNYSLCSTKFLKRIEYNEIFKYITINRIYQGIQYLNSNELVHRDIKPSNILIDHDFIPYISDFETIRNINDKEEEYFTYDFGTNLYASPEQIKKGLISYPTDIYSFGQTIYFLIERKNMFNLKDTKIYEKLEKNQIPILNASDNLQNLLKSCVQFNQENRLNINQIKSILIDEIKNFDNLLDCLLNDKMNIENYQIIQLFLENILLISPVEKDIDQLIQIILCFRTLYLLKMNGNMSLFYIMLGDLYHNGIVVKQDFIKMKEYYTLAANLNNSDAIVYLGTIYKRGYGVDKDLSKAKEYYEIAAKQNNSKAFRCLGHLYIRGLGVKQDYAKAKDYFELAAKQNDPDAFLSLANMYRTGTGVKKDYSMAKKFAELSANENFSKAFTFLGNLYKHGMGVIRDNQKANEYYEKASKQDDSINFSSLGELFQTNRNDKQDHSKTKENDELAINIKNPQNYLKLGKMYENGQGVNRDYSKAKEYYELAAQFNNPLAFISLGNLYRKGLGVENDYSKAKEYYELAAQQNNPLAFVYLGNLYYLGLGVNQDYSKARKYYELAAKMNNAKAFDRLGNIYEKGLGVRVDYSMAKQYYELAANQNEPEALNNLGNLYENGLGVEINYSKAKYYYELAAKQNNAHALHNLCKLYEYGLGVKSSDLKAVSYFELSAQQNNIECIIKMGFIYLSGSYGIEKNYIKSKEYFDLAAKENNHDALFYLGLIYFYGLGVEKDYEKGIKYLERSAHMNDCFSLIQLGKIYLAGYSVPKDENKAVHYFEKAAQLENPTALYILGLLNINQNPPMAKKYLKSAAKYRNSEALFVLGYLYTQGEIVKQNFSKAEKYLTLATYENNSDAYQLLGTMYFNGIGVERDIRKGFKYFEYAGQLMNSKSLLILGQLYSAGNKFIDIDITKAIDCYLKCISNYDKKSQLFNNNYSPFTNSKTNLIYVSYNDLGLIYITVYEDVNKAVNYIKEAAFAEYPFGQNNYGLLIQFYFDKIENAKHMYMKSATHNFALAEFNLGHLYEMDNNINQAIDFYKKSSEHEDEELVFQGTSFSDGRIEKSKMFIICLTNLKLSLYYFLQNQFDESKKYFIKSLSKLISLNEKYEFHFQFFNIESKNCFSYIKNYILNHPTFNLSNQSNLNSDLLQKLNPHLNEQINYFEPIFYDPGELFDFILKRTDLQIIFINEIKEIIEIMEEILYTHPYLILFGRIVINNSKQKEEMKKDVNKFFYNGFGMDIF